MDTIKIIITVNGTETVRWITDTTGSKVAQDVCDEVESIVGERPLREERK